MAKATKRTSDDARSSESAPNAGVLGEGVAAVYLPVDALRPHPKNPRIHGQEILNLARTILRTTWGAPIVAQRSTMRIIGGHGRLLAAQEILAGIEVDGILRGGHEHVFDRDAPGPGLVPVCRCAYTASSRSGSIRSSGIAWNIGRLLVYYCGCARGEARSLPRSDAAQRTPKE
jgi:hypothetical protein